MESSSCITPYLRCSISGPKSLDSRDATVQVENGAKTQPPSFQLLPGGIRNAEEVTAMRLEISWNQQKRPVELADGAHTAGGNPDDGVFLEGLPHGLLKLQVEGERLTVISQRSVRIGEARFPPRVPRLLLEGEELHLPNGVVLHRVVDEKRRDSRKLVATAFVAQGLLSGHLSPGDTRAATLTCVTGLDQGRVFPIPFDDNEIGRADDATIRIRDRAVSRRHARLVRDGRDFVLCLVSSSMNGILVNGRLVRKKSVVLKTGDVIEMGRTLLRFHGPERAPEEITIVQPALPVADSSGADMAAAVSEHHATEELPPLKAAHTSSIGLEVLLLTASVLICVGVGTAVWAFL